jgi:8-amino-7-oxononanoate synthase
MDTSALRVTRRSAAAGEAAKHWGASAGASSLMSGSTALFRGLDDELAESEGHDACVLFGSAFLSDVDIDSLLAGSGHAILSDALDYASLSKGCRLSRAETIGLRSLRTLRGPQPCR